MAVPNAVPSPLCLQALNNEILVNLIRPMDGVTKICLAMTSHQFYDLVQITVDKPLKSICLHSPSSCAESKHAFGMEYEAALKPYLSIFPSETSAKEELTRWRTIVKTRGCVCELPPLRQRRKALARLLRRVVHPIEPRSGA